jgi:murein DD-endopeptidase MepM/ murein hydrolase activator NlpD
MHPVPGFEVTTAYGIKGPYWRACQFHTGIDIAAPAGTQVVAARGGIVRHTKYGTAFGPYQFAIVASDGSEDFYAHVLNRPANGRTVKAGETVAKVGALGNATGPHLHFERHAKAGSWNCSNMRDPAPSLKEGSVAVWQRYSGKPAGVLKVPNGDYVRLDCDVADPPFSGFEHHMAYLNCDPVWKIAKGQPGYEAQVGVIRVKYVREDGDSTAYQDFTVTPQSAAFLITATHWEEGRKEVGGRWWVRVRGDLDRVDVGTRYVKIASVG